MSHCGKVVYETRTSAKQAAKEIRSRKRTDGKLRPYRCFICQGWHLTSQPNVREKKSE